MSTKSDGYNFFALSNTTSDPEVRRIKVEQPVQPELAAEFQKERGELLLGPEVEHIAFTGTYRAEEGEIFHIDNFPLPQTFLAAVEHPLSVPALMPGTSSEWNSIHAIVAARWNGGKPEVIAQAFDRRRLLEKRFSLVISGDTFTKLTEPGLILDNRAAAVLEDGRLYFRSYTDARRIFDLSKWYREATAEDVQAFTQHKALSFENSEEFLKHADTWVRRKIALIEDSELLDAQKPTELARKAKKYKLTIPVEKGRLVMPADKRSMKDVLRFLEENYFTSDLTGKQYLSNSKRLVT